MACRRGGKVSGTLWEHDETRGGLRARRVWCVPNRIHSGSADHASGEWCRRAVEGPRQDLSLPTSRNNLYPWHHQWPCIPFPLMQLDSCILVGFICLQSLGLFVASVRGIALIAAAAAAGEWVECSRPGLTVVGGRHSCLAPGSDSGAGQALWGGGKVEDRGGGKVEGGGRDQKVKWGARRGPTVLR